MNDELKPCLFKFGDLISNGFASDDNPTKTGFFVRTVRRTGRLNPGMHVELTNGKGKMWQTPWRHGHRLTRTHTHSAPEIETLTMKLSDGREEYYTRINCDGRTFDVRRYGNDFRNRADYEHAELCHVLLGEPRPDLMDPKYADKEPVPTPPMELQYGVTNIVVGDPVVTLTPAPQGAPLGAIENGRELFRRIINFYDFLHEGGHPLELCSEWLELKSHFEYLAEYVRTSNARIAELEASKLSRQTAFDMRWKADMRAIKRWQEETGEELTWPDHADLCVWLMKKLAESAVKLADVLFIDLDRVQAPNDELATARNDVLDEAKAGCAEYRQGHETVMNKHGVSDYHVSCSTVASRCMDIIESLKTPDTEEDMEK